MAARVNPKGIAKLRGALQSHIERGRIPGAVAVVARAGRIEFIEALGRLDPQSGAAMREDAIFRIYSMTKPIVSLAALMLMEDGLLQMNQPLSLFMP
jgi:CubicO group peptidase (beta-lactamase class C family)